MFTSISFSQNNKNFTVNKSQQSFCAWNRTVYKAGSKVEVSHRNDTAFLRITKDFPDFWEQATDFFVEKFKNKKKVNVSFYGCADGSESASFLLTMMTRFPKSVWEKFANINAIDYDLAAIEKAKSNKYTLTYLEIGRLRKMLGDKVNEYFIGFPKTDCKSADVQLTDKITSKINYRQANVLEDVKNVEKNDSLIFARAFWPYLERNIPVLARKFGERLQEDSCLVISRFDRRGCSWHNVNIDKLLRQGGFKNSKVDLIFEK